MIVSKSRKFVFVHIPKNGGTSVSAALKPFSSRRSLFHPYRAHETIAQLLSDRPKFAAFYKFAFVRNPWDRMVSYYHFWSKRQTIPAMGSIRDFHGFLVAFDRAEEWMQTRRVVKPQLDFITTGDGKLAVDFVGRHESLAADFAAVCRHVGISAELPLLNASRHDPYRTYYDAWGRDMIGRHFAADIAAFDYRFE